MSAPQYGHVRQDSSEALNDIADDDHDPMLPTLSRRGPALSESNQKRRAVILFSLTVILLFADQNLMAPNLTAMARDFGFTDSQRDTKLGGDIALAFFVLGAPASYVVGLLADSSRIARVQLFAIVVGLGEGACAMTYLSRNYWELYVCRAITGFSLGGALPLIYSILGDLYPADQRHMVSSLVGIGAGIGIAFGQGVAGFLGPSRGWRLPFLVVSIPALMCAALVLLLVDEPERGGMEKAVRLQRQHQPCRQDNGLDLETSRQYAPARSADEDDREDDASISNDKRSTVELPPLDGIDQQEQAASCSVEQPSRRRKSDSNTQLPLDAASLVHSIENGVLLVDETPDYYHMVDNENHCNAMRTLLQTPTVVLSLLQGGPGCIPWGIVNTYLNDYLAENRGMTVEFATTTLLLFGFGNFLGMLIGGAGGSSLYRWDRRYPALLAGSMACLSCACFWVMINHVDNTSNMAWIATVAVSTGLTSGTTGPIVKATLQNVTHPQARGQAFALLNTFDDFGRGLGPVFVAALIESLDGNRTRAFTWGALGWMVCGCLNTAMYWTVERDEDVVQQRILLENQVARSRTASRCWEMEDDVDHDGSRLT